MRLVPVGSLKVGSVVAKSIYNDQGHILLKEGASLSESLIDKLHQNGIMSLYVQDHYSYTEIEDVISPELRSKAVGEVRKVFEMVQRELKNQVDDMRQMHVSLKKRLSVIADQKYYEAIFDIIDSMMNDLTRNRDAMVGLVDIKNMNAMLYQHAVQVTVLSLVLGIDLKMSKSELKDLAIGAMLHDIGLSMIDPKLWVYRDDFTELEKKIFESHPNNGYQFIKETCLLPATSTITILEHHEQVNGMGYPIGIGGETIHRNAKIVAIANAYDKLTSGIGGPVTPPNEAIEYIMGHANDNSLFDNRLAGRFVRRIVAYPTGSHVRLSNGKRAVVVGHNMNHPMRPIIGLIPSEGNGKDLLRIDLMDPKNYNLTILQTIYD